MREVIERISEEEQKRRGGMAEDLLLERKGRLDGITIPLSDERLIG